MTSLVESPSRLKTSQDLREWLSAIGISFVTALLVIAPFFWLGTASGHDISFHASSWMDVAGQWREGIVYPRWTEWANHGFGEPRFVFYPPLSWMLGAALSFLVPWNAVPAVFIVLVQTLAGICAFALARRFLLADAALFGAAGYAANPYALLIIYMRSDFAELLACALMPLVALAVLQLCGLVEDHGRSMAKVTPFFAVVFAAVWLSNAPAGVLASYSVALVFAWAAFEEKSFRPLWRGAGGLALGFGLAGSYLVPAAYEQRWVNIAQALSSGLLPSQNFLYTQINDPEHNAFNWIASNVAVLLMVMTTIAALGARRRATTQEQAKGGTTKLWRALLVLSVVAAILMVRVSSIFWEYLPKLRFVQFPWRWMAILAVPYAYFMAAALPRPGRARWAGSIAVLAVIVGTATFLIHRAWWDSEDLPVLQEAIANDQGFEGTDEYDPVGDDHTNLPEKAPRVQILPAEESGGAAPKAEIRIERWTAQERELRVTTSQASRAALRLLYYQAWRVTTNGRVVTPQRAETSSQMIIPIPAGESRIEAHFLRTPDRTSGGALSVASLFTLFMIVWVSQSKRS
ncbi:MAG TPA: hypothetical protein VFN26_23365 [Candidatus Acidoferrum sp.]|nr:hypothetical protein [Candidatus Acidoferrum sp.]